ncbi:conserved hypothetical protein [Perkinsus marinus ATCC 50983]|uniref:Sugar phosphate transporter domain-containing protein n=1 Tax=Perkinsus marinus (strain ATCC 50983 / TXsc) TaxID=423536 RepID=C5LBH9_PERM5|nr:conserved hypothetical protein [Perkinsus marinus ATCC 50983]EER05800.1 conserved hypothetical protein [Perkinsus marinus ATCC 50983]|eukprot:XP_002773984.1 conserved hypothetical protein [Perkinsus marinus ATCC 50983]
MNVLGYGIGEIAIIVANFTCNVALVNSVKYIQYTLHYPYPLLISAVHMVFSWLACGVYVKFNVPALREYTLKRYMVEVFPVAAMASASIGCGNMALKYIFPSFHELLQQTSPAAQVLVCVLIYHQRYNLPTYLSMIPICGGAIMCSGGEVNFNVIGVTFSIGAVLTRALKNTMQSRLMTTSFTNIELLYVLAPANLFFFLSGSFLFEGVLAPTRELISMPTALFAVVFSALLACTYNLLAFKMLQVLSPVGAMVVHTLKTPATLMVSTVLFGNKVGISQIIGFVIITAGVYYYKNYGKEVKPEDYQKIDPKNGGDPEEFDLELADRPASPRL